MLKGAAKTFYRVHYVESLLSSVHVVTNPGSAVCLMQSPSSQYKPYPINTCPNGDEGKFIYTSVLVSIRGLLASVLQGPKVEPTRSLTLDL